MDDKPSDPAEAAWSPSAGSSAPHVYAALGIVLIGIGLLPQLML